MTIEDTFLYYFQAPDTSRYVISLDFNSKNIFFWISRNVIFYFSVFLIISNTFAYHFKIESVKLKFVVIAKMYLKIIDNDLQNLGTSL